MCEGDSGENACDLTSLSFVAEIKTKTNKYKQQRQNNNNKNHKTIRKIKATTTAKLRHLCVSASGEFTIIPLGKEMGSTVVLVLAFYISIL